MIQDRRILSNKYDELTIIMLTTFSLFILEAMVSKFKLQTLLYLWLKLAATPVDIFDIYRASLTDRSGLALLK